MRGWMTIGAVGLAAAATCGAGATSELRASTYLRTYVSPPTNMTFEYADLNTGLVDPVGAGVQDGQPYISSLSTAIAKWGNLRARTRAQSNIPGNQHYWTERATATASFREDVTITSAAVAPGTMGVAVVSMSFDGGFDTADQGLGADSDWVATGSLGLHLGAAGQSAGREYLATYRCTDNIRHWTVVQDPDQGGGLMREEILIDTNPTQAPSFSFVDSVALEFQFIFGTPFELSAGLQSDSSSFAYNDAGVGAIMDADAMHTAFWAGIEMVTLADGTPIAEFASMGMSSGLSYNGAIPAPGGALALLGALAALRRRR